MDVMSIYNYYGCDAVNNPVLILEENRKDLNLNSLQEVEKQ